MTKTQIGLGSVDNTADTDKNVATARTLATARTIQIALNSTSAASFNGSKITQIFDDFSILIKVGTESVDTRQYDYNGMSIYEERIVVRLAKRTQAEIQIEQMMAAMKQAGLM